MDEDEPPQRMLFGNAMRDLKLIGECGVVPLEPVELFDFGRPHWP